MPKILFVLKRKENYNENIDKHIGVTTGLYNSASFVNNMLVSNKINSSMVVVTDNNDIDREITKHKPTHVIIEALWVVPTKFDILQKLHPTVTWIIRLHSEMPFMAGEGMAMDWVGEYANFRNVVISCNAPRMLADVRFFLSHKNGWDNETVNRKVIYLPNYYPTTYKHKIYNNNKEHIDIGCFGAVRPLKNHMLQAFAAIRFAEKIGKKLHFHINVGRLEMNGDPVLHNLRGLFQHLLDNGHRLITHEWTHRDDFLKLCEQMDIGMQVSFSETFNIVGADLISQGVPLVSSSEIPWTHPKFNAIPTDSANIYDKLQLTYHNVSKNVAFNQELLTKYVDETCEIWKKYFKK